MSKASLIVAACATLLSAGTALATPTPQQKCDYARITAWKAYVSCMEAVVAKDAKGVSFDEFAAFAKCRHGYFKKWTAFQKNKSLATSACQTGGGPRFVDNGDGTVTDTLSTLVWEKKDNLDSTQNLADPHDADNVYTWSAVSINEDGTVFTNFLGTVNGGGFAGANGWRLPTLAELQSIVLDFACKGAGGGATCSCSSNPCIDSTFGPTLSSSNTNGYYWSATSYVPNPVHIWGVTFSNGDVSSYWETGNALAVRAVRGGL